MEDFRDKSIVITGASGGIGRELARALGRRGARLILVARREDRLRELADELIRGGAAGAHGIPADLTQAAACDEVYEQAAACGPIDLLINNAGSGLYGEFARQELGEVERVMRLNMDALVRLTRLCVPAMATRGSGRIVNVASLAGYQPFPYMTIYAASKGFVIDFSLALREELRDTGVSVICICPGTTKTEFFDGGGFDHRRGEFLKMGAEPAAVAEECVRAIARGKALFVPGRANRISGVIQWLLPQRMLARMLGTYMKPRE